MAHFQGKATLAAVFLSLGSAVAQDSASEAVRHLSDLPGFDFSRLTKAAKVELASVFADEFDYCGRPMTLLASLRKGDACRHTRRLASQAARLAADGSPAAEIVNALARYHQSFGPKRVVFKPDDRQCVGPRDAQVTLVEFSDFECPGCAMARPLLEEFARARPALRFCSLLFPLSGHVNAVLAGQAALFARDSGKFWPMHDALFENQLSLSDARVKELAAKLGLDVAALGAALAGQKYLGELKDSKETGRLAGVDGTPSLFVNGRKLVLPGPLSAETLASAVEDEVDWMAGNNAWPSH